MRSPERAPITRVAALALDAATLPFVECLIDQGALPNIAAIRSRSARLGLHNAEFYRGTSVWPAFLEGRDDAGHPDAGGFAFDPDTFRVRRTRDPERMTFYERADGVVPITIDAPHLGPDGRGVRICGWGGHVRAASRASVPPGLLDHLDEHVGRHPAAGMEHQYAWHRPEFVGHFGDALADGARARVEVARRVCAQFPSWNFLVVVMSESHSAGETFGHGLSDDHPLASLPIAEAAREQLVRVYRALDDAVGAFAAMLPDDAALVLFALHGMAANDADLPSQALLPELVSRMQGGPSRWPLVDRASWRRAGCPPVVPTLDETWSQHLASQWRGPNPRGSRMARLRRRYSVREPGGVDRQVPYWYHRAWRRQSAFALPSVSDSRIRINLEGRERDGVVPADEYARVCATVDGWLRTWRDVRTGAAAVRDVVFPLAGDPLAPGGLDADIVVRWVPAVDAVEHPEVGIVGPLPFRRTGGHTPNGFAWFSGPGVVPGEHGDVPAADLPRRMLALLG